MGSSSLTVRSVALCLLRSLTRFLISSSSTNPPTISTWRPSTLSPTPSTASTEELFSSATIWICEKETVTKWEGDIISYKDHLKAKVMKEAKKNAKKLGLDTAARGNW